MKKCISILMIVACMFAFTGCGNNKEIDGKTYTTYGYFNKDSKMNSKIEYELVLGNVIWSCLLVETIIFPIYFLGFSLWEPVGLEKNYKSSNKGVVK